MEAIIANQVKAAKEGNKDAIKFVFEQLLGGSHMRGATFIQNNWGKNADPRAPAMALPGSPDKIETMRRRVAAGLSPTAEGDAKPDAA